VYVTAELIKIGGIMKRVSVGLLALFCSVCLVWAVDVDISGTVTKTGGGAIQGAAVSLTKVKGLTSTTDADGKFALKGSVSVLLQMN
jgi:hypothetical protein